MKSMTFNRALIAVLAGGLVGYQGAAFAITVNDSSDLVAAGDGVCTLREALNNANADLDTTGGDCDAGVGDDLITFSPVTDGVPITLTGAAGDDANAGGDLDIFDDNALIIQGNGMNDTIIEAGPSVGAGVDRVIHVHTRVPELEVNDLRIRRGNAMTSAGGGLFIDAEDGAAVTLRRCGINSNSASLGGGILFAVDNGSLTIEESDVVSNHATQALSLGGGIQVTGNQMTLTIVDSYLGLNTAVDGGGISLAGANGMTEIHNTIVDFNAAARDGGGISMGSSLGSLIVRGSTMMNNSAGRNGGAMSVNVIGAIGGNTVMVNSTVSNNRADDHGGGISIGSELGNNGDEFAMVFVTITQNTADADTDGEGDGGGIVAFSGTFMTGSSILAGNIDLGGEAPECGGDVTTNQGYNLVQSLSGCGLIPTTGDIIGVDPLLDPLNPNGGLTPTHALQAASPAQNSGASGAFCTDNPVAGEDQRGVVRDPLCDIGAYESDQAVTVPTIPTVSIGGALILIACLLGLGLKSLRSRRLHAPLDNR